MYLDPAGTILVVAGLVGVVYGLSEAETKGWGAPTTIALLVAGVVLLAAFVLVERRVAHPLLPLRIVLNRFRGGSYLAIGLSAIGLFGVYGAIAGAGGAVGLLLGGVLTEYLSWRWCLYVNVILALVAVTGAVRLLANQPRDTKAVSYTHLTLPTIYSV